MDKILVTYASRTHTTKGIAEAIGNKLIKDSFQVEMLPMANVKDLTGYCAVVAGSAIQSAQWLPEALHFVEQHQAALQKLPVAMFSVCMTLAMKNGEKYKPAIQQWVEPVRMILQPVSEGIFKGKLEIRKIPSAGQRIKFRISVLTGVWKEGDHRDWEAINKWAGELKDKLTDTL